MHGFLILEITTDHPFLHIFKAKTKIRYVCVEWNFRNLRECCSTKGVGATSPDPSGAQTLEDGVVVPLGKPKQQSGQKVIIEQDHTAEEYDFLSWLLKPYL